MQGRLGSHPADSFQRIHLLVPKVRQAQHWDAVEGRLYKSDRPPSRPYHLLQPLCVSAVAAC